jgi:hypothetical protein
MEQKTVKCDIKFLFDPTYNNLIGDEIICKTKDKETVYEKLGFRLRPDKIINLERQGLQVKCDFSNMCTTSLICTRNMRPENVEDNIKIHNQICHTQVDGYKMLKCPNYNKCRFAISFDLLLTSEEWREKIDKQVTWEIKGKNLSPNEIRILREELENKSELINLRDFY